METESIHFRVARLTCCLKLQDCQKLVLTLFCFFASSQGNEAEGCPLEGGVVGTGGATAHEACCFCAGPDATGQGNGGVNAISNPITGTGDNNNVGGTTNPDTTSNGDALNWSMITTGLVTLILLLGLNPA